MHVNDTVPVPPHYPIHCVLCITKHAVHLSQAIRFQRNSCFKNVCKEYCNNLRLVFLYTHFLFNTIVQADVAHTARLYFTFRIVIIDVVSGLVLS